MPQRVRVPPTRRPPSIATVVDAGSPTPTPPGPSPQTAPAPASASLGDLCPQCSHEVSDAWLVCAWCGQQLTAPAELVAGTRVSSGRYQVLGVIGRGGFGITYEVGDRRLERRVAMKELFPESAVRHGSMVLTPPAGRPAFKAARERFMREARVLARFTHPGIVRVFEVFEEHGTAYLVMELLQGRTLIDLLRQHGRPFDEADVVDVAGRVAAALRPVHAAGVLHRDVNPSNVMMTHHGRIVVIDFGLARDYDQDHTAGMTRVVTPGYAPLEQYRGEGRFGPSTDVYGLAATLYRLATGKVPVSALERSGGTEMIPPHRINSAISKSLSAAILDGLELEPEHRPQDLDSFLARLGIGRLPDDGRSLLLETVPLPDGSAPTAATESVLPFSSDDSSESVVAPKAVGTPVLADVDSTSADVTVMEAAPAAEGATVVDRSYVAPSALHIAVADPTRTVSWSQGPPLASGPPQPQPQPPHGGHPIRPADPRLGLAVGPHRPGRKKVTVPLAVLAIACGAAAPVAMTGLVVLFVLPWLATFGDSVAHRLRVEHGVVGGWAERRVAPAALAPIRFVRNVLTSLFRASPVLGVGAVTLAGWYGLDGLDVPRSLLHVLLRLIGATVVGVIVVTAREGSPRFRTGLALDELVVRWVPGGRTNERVVVGWLVAAALTAGALWLTPSNLPLP